MMQNGSMASPQRIKQAAVLVCGATWLVAAAAQAQPLVDPIPNLGSNFQRDKSVSVLERKQPGYELPSVQIGAFIFDPAVSAGYNYDDNIYASSVEKEGDSYAVLKTEEKVTSTWSRDSVSADLHAQYASYADHVDEDNLTGGALIAGRFDINGNNALVATASADHLVESRFASGAPTFTKHPVEYNRGLVGLSAATAINRFKIEATFSYEALDFYNAETPSGVAVDQHYRNRGVTDEQLQASYAVSPDTAVFVRVAGNQRNFPSNVGSTSSYLRSSDGFEATTGINLDLKDLVRGEASIGYLEESFKDSRLPTVSGPGADGQIDWFPTGLTTVTFRFRRILADSAIAQSPILVSSSGGVEIDHELLRSLILLARVDYESDAYQDLDRTDTRPSAELGATYRFNRYVDVILRYDYLNQRSSGIERGVGFADNRVSMAAAAHY
jgi:hypothetical protein